MMNFTQLNDKISAKGFRKRTSAQMIYGNGGEPLKVIDYDHPRKDDIVSLYLNEAGSVVYAEYTKVVYDRMAHKFSQSVMRADGIQQFNSYLGI